MLVCAAAASLIAVAGRVAADADQPTLSESLTAIAENRLAYSVAWLARIVSSIALAAAAFLLWKKPTAPEWRSLALVLRLFVLSGVCTLLSGVCSVLLTAMAPATGGSPVEPGAALETIELLRWVFGKLGFSAVGLAMVAASRPLMKGGGVWRLASPVTALLGAAMVLIWFDAAELLHRISGPAFVIWLVVIGALLLTGRARGMLAGAPNTT